VCLCGNGIKGWEGPKAEGLRCADNNEKQGGKEPCETPHAPPRFFFSGIPTTLFYALFVNREEEKREKEGRTLSQLATD